MPTMVEVKCENCSVPRKVRVADRKRGWGRFCSKSCKASYQEKRTGQYANLLNRGTHIGGDEEVVGYDYDAVKGWLG